MFTNTRVEYRAINDDGFELMWAPARTFEIIRDAVNNSGRSGAFHIEARVFTTTEDETPWQRVDGPLIPVGLLTTLDDLFPVTQKVLDTHFDADNQKVSVVGSVLGASVARGQGRFEGLMGTVTLRRLDDGAVRFVMRVIPSFAEYVTTLLPEDVTEARIMRHAEHGARLMSEQIAERHAERAAAVRSYVPN